MAASNARGDLEKDGNQDMWIDVQQSSDQLQRTMKSPRVVPSGVEPGELRCLPVVHSQGAVPRLAITWEIQPLYCM